MMLRGTIAFYRADPSLTAAATISIEGVAPRAVCSKDQLVKLPREDGGVLACQRGGGGHSSLLFIITSTTIVLDGALVNPVQEFPNVLSLKEFDRPTVAPILPFS